MLRAKMLAEHHFHAIGGIEIRNLLARKPQPRGGTRTFLARLGMIVIARQPHADRRCDSRLNTGGVEVGRRHEKILRKRFTIRLKRDYATGIRSEVFLQLRDQTFAAQRNFRPLWLAQWNVLALQIQIVGKKSRNP